MVRSGRWVVILESPRGLTDPSILMLSTSDPQSCGPFVVPVEEMKRRTLNEIEIIFLVKL